MSHYQYWHDLIIVSSKKVVAEIRALIFYDPIWAYSHFLGRKKFTTETQRTKR